MLYNYCQNAAFGLIINNMQNYICNNNVTIKFFKLLLSHFQIDLTSFLKVIPVQKK